VDNCLLIGPNKDYIASLKKALHKVYAIEDRGPANFFLGVQIVQDRSKRQLWLHQAQYVKEALRTFNLEDSRPLLVPLQPGLLNELAKSYQKTVSSPEIKLYQQIIGTLMYLMLMTRPDIAFSVQWLSRFLQAPTVAHLNAAKGLLKYLKGTMNLAIIYSYTVSKSLQTLQPVGYCDSNFAGNKVTSKSTYGYLFKLAGGPISWKSKRATTIALSTTEAETDALTETIRELQWLKGLFEEIKISINPPLVIHYDNQGSISNASNPNLHSRTKHTLLKFSYVRECVQKGIV